MARLPRKGSFSSRGQQPPSDTRTGPEAITRVTSSIEPGRVAEEYFDFEEFRHVPLIWNNRRQVARTMLAGKTAPSLKSERKLLRTLAKHLSEYSLDNGNALAFAHQIDRDAAHSIIPYIINETTSLHSASHLLRGWRRFLLAVGADDALLPVNPFPPVRSGAPPGVTPADLKSLLRHAKNEAEVIRRRRKELNNLMDNGQDPRGRRQGNGGWKNAANRVWAMPNIFGLRLRSFDHVRFQEGLHGPLRGLQGMLGAEVTRPEGGVRRQVGWKGHLRWFFPFSDDLAPFIVLMLLRTGWNVSVVAAIRSGAWHEPYPFKLGVDDRETYAYIVSRKTRGRSGVDVPANVLRTPSSTRPWSHPFRLLQFVEDLTSELRREVKARIVELDKKVDPSSKETKELRSLSGIQDDLFLYKTEQGVRSLRLDTESSLPRWLAAFFDRAKYVGSVRDLRSAPILFSYELSGQNLFVSQLIASHSKSETTMLYLRRRKAVEAIECRSAEIFEHSLELIRTGKFEVSRVREILASQGVAHADIRNFLNAESTTRWGNRCGNPLSPPAEFAKGTASGEPCAGQDCLSGCPHARWFPESVDFVARNLVSFRRIRATLGAESTDGSTLDVRIGLCETLLSMWPQTHGAAALAAAETDDLGVLLTGAL